MLQFSLVHCFQTKAWYSIHLSELGDKRIFSLKISICKSLSPKQIYQLTPHLRPICFSHLALTSTLYWPHICPILTSHLPYIGLISALYWPHICPILASYLPHIGLLLFHTTTDTATTTTTTSTNTIFNSTTATIITQFHCFPHVPPLQNCGGGGIEFSVFCRYFSINMALFLLLPI